MGLFFEDIEAPPLVGPFPLAATHGLSAYKSGLFAAETPLSQRTIDADQFTLFQLLGNETGPVIADLHNVEPTHKGNNEHPDVRVGIELMCFNIGSQLNVDSNTRVTLRIDIGENFTAASFADTIFWAIAAGMHMHKSQDQQKTSADEFRLDLSASFRREPIDLAGSIGTIRIAVVAHEEPTWWRRVFKFAAEHGDVLSAVGFPAITGRALKLIDYFFDSIDGANPHILVHSQPITVVFSEKAKNYFEMGLQSVRVAVLNPGWFLMIRYADAAQIAQYEPIYLGGYGALVPRSAIVQTGALSSNPLNEFTYAVLRVHASSLFYDGLGDMSHNRFVLRISAGGKPTAAHVSCRCLSGPCEYYVGSRGIFECEYNRRPHGMLVQALDPGYWSMFIRTPEHGSGLDLPPLPQDNGDPWWAFFLCKDGSAAPSTPVTIAVLDTELGGLSDCPGIKFLTSSGAIQPSIIQYSRTWHHGEVICRLLSPAGCQPAICPNAKVVGVQLMKGKTSRFEFEDVVRAVYTLLEQQEVDIINLSAGTHETSLEALRVVARVAARHGVLCVAAAGNEGFDVVAWPARYQEWIAVGAIGSVHGAPAGSNVSWFRDIALRNEVKGERPVGRFAELNGHGEIFHPPFSCFGFGLNMVAPGTNLIVRKMGQPAFDVSGTSFATPLVCGTLAATLGRDATFIKRPRDETRTAYMRSVLLSLCRRVGINELYQGAGIVCVN